MRCRMGILIAFCSLFGFFVAGCGNPSEYKLPKNPKTGIEIEVGRAFTQKPPPKPKDPEAELPPYNIIKPVKTWRYKRKKSVEGNPETELKVRDKEIVDFLNKFVGTQYKLAERIDVIHSTKGVNELKRKHVPNISYFDITKDPPNEEYFAPPRRLPENSPAVFAEYREKIRKLYEEDFPNRFYIDRIVNRNRRAGGYYSPITRLWWPEELESGIKDPDQNPSIAMENNTKRFSFASEAEKANSNANLRPPYQLAPNFFTQSQNIFTVLGEHISKIKARVTPYPDPPFKTKFTMQYATPLDLYNIEGADEIRRIHMEKRQEFRLFNGHVPIEVDPGAFAALPIKAVRDMFSHLWTQFNKQPAGMKELDEAKGKKGKKSPILSRIYKSKDIPDGSQGSLYGMTSEIAPNEEEVIAWIKEYVDGILAQVKQKQDQTTLYTPEMVVPGISEEEEIEEPSVEPREDEPEPLDEDPDPSDEVPLPGE